MAIQEIASEDDIKKLISDDTKLVIIDCYANWCKPCKILGKKLIELNDVFRKKYRDLFIIAKLNIDDEKLTNFVDINNITSLPTVLYIRGDTVIDKTVGCDVIDIVEKINGYIKQ